MVTGTEFIFDNIYAARDYIVQAERTALSDDATLKSPITCISADTLDFHRPFDPNIDKPIPVDSIDYPFNLYFNRASSDKFIMSRLRSGRFAFKPNLCKRKYLFRGESEFHSPCKPNLFRNPRKNYFLDDFIQSHEMYRLILSHPLVQLLDLGVILDGRLCRFEMNLYGLTQHYYNKTSMLDLTSDINVAMFFATQKYDPVTDTYSPIIDEGHEPGVLYYYDIDILNDFKGPQGVERLSTIGLQVFPRSGQQKGFLYNLEKGEDFNNVVRLKAFRFKHVANIATEINQKHMGGEQLFPKDILALHWKNKDGKKNIVSSDAVEINLMMNPNETFNSIKQKLQNNYGITVENYKPELTMSELHEYYESIKKEGIWEDFCSQIFIPGDTSGKMMSDLLNVPNCSEYKWAFQEGINYIIDYNKGYLLKKCQHILNR